MGAYEYGDDCNDNGIPDDQDIAAGTSADCSGNGVPDECEPDCNDNGLADSCDIANQSSEDCNANSVPDECEGDTDGDGVIDDCDPCPFDDPDDVDGDGVCDSDDVCPGFDDLADADQDGRPDGCDNCPGHANSDQADCDEDGAGDVCTIAECPVEDPSCQDCQGNGIPDGCDITSGVLADSDENGVPDACQCIVPSAPQADPGTPDQNHGTKNRYLSFQAGDEERSQAIRVVFGILPGYEYAEGRAMYVQEPYAVTEAAGSDGPTPPPAFWAAELGCDPFYTDWTQYDGVDVYDDAIVPGAELEVCAIDEVCGALEAGSYSEPLVVAMSMAGDVVGGSLIPPASAPQGTVDFIDIAALVNTFKNEPDAIRKARGDIMGNSPLDALPNRKVDFIDITAAVDAFRGEATPPIGPPVEDPCP
jgi:hypothetical protein